MNNFKLSKLVRFSGSRVLFALVLGLFLVMSGCEKKDDNSGAPQLPPLESMVMDFSEFNPQQKSTTEIDTTYFNWAVAASIVVTWNAFIVDTLAIPVVAFTESFNHIAVKDTNDTWKWTYTVTVADVNYTAELYGKIVGTNVSWKMYVSQEGGFSKFLWFEGLCDIARTAGTWTLYENPRSPNKVLSIVWTKDWSNGTGDITYTNIRSNDAGNGDYIQYGITSDTDFDAFYDIYDYSKTNLVNINYNRETHNGSICLNGTCYCWDELLQDITCP